MSSVLRIEESKGLGPELIGPPLLFFAEDLDDSTASRVSGNSPRSRLVLLQSPKPEASSGEGFQSSRVFVISIYFRPTV